MKAPEPFLPKTEVRYSQKEKIISDIHENLNQIQQIVSTYSEEELDTLTLPHLLLELVTIREMFYLMSYPLYIIKNKLNNSLTRIQMTAVNN